MVIKYSWIFFFGFGKMIDFNGFVTIPWGMLIQDFEF